MYPNYTPEDFKRLLAIPSTADYMSVRDDIARITTAPLSWHSAFEDTQEIATLIIGPKSGDPSSIGITFSRFGNLCLAPIPPSPILEGALIESVLSKHGWIIVPHEAANTILHETTEERVGDCFF